MGMLLKIKQVKLWRKFQLNLVMGATNMSKQALNGKAFEYALLKEFKEKLELRTAVKIIENNSYKIALSYFGTFTEKERSTFSLYASFAVNFLIDLEPRLIQAIDDQDILNLELVADKEGQSGDVRDVLALRINQAWEIGISAKNNHRAVKHSRLSHKLDFGDKWLGIPCSKQYFSDIEPIFSMLSNYRTESNSTKTWKSLGNYHDSVYMPVLIAFRDELIRLDQEHPGVVATNLIQYLIGKKDFYKVIKSKGQVEIQAYNLHGTLNMPFNKHKPKAKVERLKLPTRLIEVVFQDNSKSTLLVTLSDGWQISFRIHNASSKIESSLKFDINLISSPHSLFTNKLFVP